LIPSLARQALQFAVLVAIAELTIALVLREQQLDHHLACCAHAWLLVWTFFPSAAGT
jgi:hypothetical protein